MFAGPRVIKTAIAAALAVWIAERLSPHNAVFAGILAILGVQVTRKKTLKTVWFRFTAGLFGLLVAGAMFPLLGYAPWVIGLIIVLLFPLLVRLGMQEGITTGSVMVFHLYSLHTVTPERLANEVLLIVIGLSMALLVNVSYMPSVKRQTRQLTHDIDELLSQIFTHFVRHLTVAGYVWDGKEILLLEEKLAEGKHLALRTMENNLLRNEDAFYRFVRMREKQFDAVQRMMALIARIDRPISQSYLLAELFADLSHDVKLPYYGGRVFTRLGELKEAVKAMELPQTREEFEIRASLFHLLVELDRYLTIAAQEKPRRKQKHSPAAETAETKE